MKAMLAVTTALVLCVQNGVVWAQDAEESGAVAGDEGLFDAIIVTAQKREQNVQDIPISVSAFSGDSLGRLGVTEGGELGNFVPGLEITQPSGEGGQLVVYLRGAGLNDFNTNNAGPVGIYSDEVYISSPTLTSFQFFDVERVEVLKGPQGTLYGRNTTGGAIKIIAKKPTNDFSFDLNASYASFDTTSIEAAISGPLSDSVAARLAIKKDDSDGFGTNLVDGSSTSGTDSFAWRGFVEIDATDSLSILLNVHGAMNDSPTTAFNVIGTLDPVSGGRCSDAAILANSCVDALGYQGPADVFEGNYDNLQDIDHDSIGGYAQIELGLGSSKIVSVTAYDEVDHFLGEDADGSPNALLHLGYGVKSETFSQELRFEGASDNLDWVAGIFYLSEDLDQDQTADLFGALRAFTGGVSDPSGELTGAPILLLRARNMQTTESYAGFGQASLAITDDLNLTLGGRYTNERKTFRSDSRFIDEALFGPDGLQTFDIVSPESDEEAFSWRVGLDYHINPDILIYASASRGFKSGGFNGGFIVDPTLAQRQLEPYEPEFVNAYEAGIKSEFFDGDLRFNAAVFFNDFSDLQVFTIVNTGVAPVLVLDNASGAEVLGLEIDLVAQPADGLTLALSGSFLDTELVEFVTTDVGQDFSGNKLPNSPNTSLTGLIRYDFDLGNGGVLGVQGNIAYKSDQFLNTQNNPLAKQEAYAILSARLEYRSPSDIWGLALFANNITNEEHLIYASDLTDFGLLQQIYAPPRSVGVELSVSY